MACCSLAPSGRPSRRLRRAARRQLPRSLTGYGKPHTPCLEEVKCGIMPRIHICSHILGSTKGYPKTGSGHTGMRALSGVKKMRRVQVERVAHAQGGTTVAWCSNLPSAAKPKTVAFKVVVVARQLTAHRDCPLPPKTTPAIALAVLQHCAYLCTAHAPLSWVAYLPLRRLL